MDGVGFNARGIARIRADPITKAGGAKGIERSPHNTWTTTRASSGTVSSLCSDGVSDIPISASTARKASQPVPMCRDVQALKSQPTFAQRHPQWAKVFRIFTAVLAFPVLLAFNLVAIPLAYAIACFSKECGDGGLAASMGRSRLIRALWGDRFAEWLAHGDGGAQGKHALLCLVPLVLLVNALVFSADGASDLFDNAAAGFPEPQWAPRAESLYDTWSQDGCELAPRYRFQSGTWVRVS